jgi:putative PIN family toxin of toxin-antitoxin system
MRSVLDTNVVVSALLWDGAPRQLLKSGHSEGIQFFTSVPLLEELIETLSKSKFERKIAASMHSIGKLVELYSKATVVVRPIPVPRVAPDPDDDVVIGTALAAKAGFVVTGDRTLRSVAEYEGVRIVSVIEALEVAVQAASHDPDSADSGR